MSVHIGPHTFIDGVCLHCGTDMDSAEKFAALRDYAQGLRIWGAEATRDIANDILHIIEGK